jgi:hypothetical protein
VYKDPPAAPGASDFLVGYSATSTGFSDPDLTMDYGGRIYNRPEARGQSDLRDAGSR